MSSFPLYCFFFLSVKFINISNDLFHVRSIPVLKEIKDKQSQHGLKHGDYNRYRTYCSKRLQRLRQSLKQNTGRSKTMYLKRVVNQIVVDALGVKKEPIRYLLIPLMSAERAWSYAMALKQERDTRKRFHMIRRFRKAMSYAKSLEVLCNEEPTVCDLRTKLESQAYSAYMSGLFLFEREEWFQASEQLKKAQAIYSKLLENMSVEEPESVELYTQRVNELKPTLRYCAFNLNEKGANEFIEKLNADDIQDEFLATKLDALMLQERDRKSAQLSEVSWLGKQLPVNKDSVRSFLLDIDQVLADQDIKMTKLEKKLFESRDCLQTLKEAGQEKGLLFTYVSYIRQRLICKRNLELVKSVKQDQDLVRPYETIISSLTEIQSLPLEQQFGAEPVKKLSKQLDAEILAFKAYRCYHIGCTGWLDWKKSIAMLHRSGQYAEAALVTKQLESWLEGSLEELRSKAESGKYCLYGENADHHEDDESMNERTKKESNKKRVLIDRLNEFVDRSQVDKQSKLTHFPPHYECVPFKPLFFDLALNSVVFPSLEDEMGANTQNTGAGITNLVKGWFWKK